MSKILYPKDKERIARVEASEAGRRFLRRKCKRETTKRLYVRGVLMFSKFLKKSINEIVSEYKRDAEENLYKAYDKWEQIFEDFGDYLAEKHPAGATATAYFSGAVSLINANVPKSAEIHPKFPGKYSRSIPPITIEDLKVVREVADEREGAFIDVLKDCGMSQSDALMLTYKDLKKAIEDPNIRYHKIDVYRGKENVEYETWLGPNTLESLRLYFRIRRQSGEEITDKSWIFALKSRSRRQLTPKALSTIFRLLTKKTGIKISTHRLRKFFETYITAGGAHPLTAKYWMGHKITGGRDIEASYIIPPENLQREIYTKAYSKIDLRPQPDEYGMILAETKARLSGMDPEQRKRFMKELSMRKSENIKRLLEDPRIKAMLEEGRPDGKLPPIKPKFKEIPEKELLAHLNQGWQVVHNLQNGRVIVKSHQ